MAYFEDFLHFLPILFGTLLTPGVKNRIFYIPLQQSNRSANESRAFRPTLSFGFLRIFGYLHQPNRFANGELG